MKKKYNVNYKDVEVVFKNGIKVILCNVYSLRLYTDNSFCLFGHNNYGVIQTVYDYDEIEYFRILR